jgi:hypothetical protein
MQADLCRAHQGKEVTSPCLKAKAPRAMSGNTVEVVLRPYVSQRMPRAAHQDKPSAPCALTEGFLTITAALPQRNLSHATCTRANQKAHDTCEFVTSNDKPRIVAYRYIIEASIDVS